ncbi:hypothetical protein ACJ41O_003751 [Fusarium nematophilum]
MKFSSVTPFLLLAGYASAVPVERPEDIDEDVVPQINATHLVARAHGKKFTLEQKPNDHYHQPDGTTALINVYMKYNKALPQTLQRAQAKQNAKVNMKFKGNLKGTVSATPPKYYDSQYVVPVKIGTPAQTTYLNFDTGSSDFWVFSTDTYAPDQAGHILYKPRKSKTARRVDGQTWNIRYGDGTGASGIVYTDRVQVGNTVVKSQAVQSAIQVSPGIAADTFSHGIVGLAFQNLNTVRPTRQKTYFDNVMNDLALPVFTANLKKGMAGNYNFGYIDQSEYYGSIYFNKVDKNSPWWQFNVKGFQVGKSPFVKFTYSAIVDTGTTLLLLPENIVTAYYRQVKGAKFDNDMGVWLFPCLSNLPDFIFGMNGYRGKVPGHYINYGKISTTTCYGGLQSSEGIGFAILGDILLKAQFVVFDLKTRSVGFANKRTVPKVVL